MLQYTEGRPPGSSPAPRIRARGRFPGDGVGICYNDGLSRSATRICRWKVICWKVIAVSRFKFSVVVAALLACASWARAGERVVLDFQGYAWEQGGFPPSAPGDTLAIPCVVTDLSDILQIDVQAEEVTGWIGGLVSTGSIHLGNGITSTRYNGGDVRFFRDVSTGHVFAPNPPNALVPGSFVDGDLCLGGTLQSFDLFFDTNTGSGAFEARVLFDTGACLDALDALRAEGFTFGGVLSRAAAAGTVPAGYDLQVDGLVQAEGSGPETCAFDCFALTAADIMFPRDVADGFAFSTSKFHVQGEFVPCRDGAGLDPGAVAVTVRVGQFTQTLPAGSLKRDRRGAPHWRYWAPNDFGKLTEVVLAQDEDGIWEFEVAGRRQPRALLLPQSTMLALQIDVGAMQGDTQVRLVERQKKLSYRGDTRPCGHGRDKSLPPAPVPEVGPMTRLEFLPITPNPFNAQVTLRLQLPTGGPLRMALFDSRGRLVRVLFDGVRAPGEQRFVWDGTDARGTAQASGVYIVRAETPGSAIVRKLVLAK